MNNNKRYLPIIALMTVVFALISAFMLYNVYQGRTPNPDEETQEESNNSIFDIFDRRDSYITGLEQNLKIKITATKPVEVLNEIGCEGLIEPTKYQNYYKPCFDFIITNEGIKIMAATAKEFYGYQLQIGDVITHIGDKKIAECNYFDVFELIYSKEYTTKKFTLANGIVVDFKYEVYQNRCEVSEQDDVLTIKLYNLNVTTQNYVYKLATADDYEKIILDMSEATISSYRVFRQYLSLFAKDKDVLFSKPESVKAYDMHKLTNCEIIIGENSDPGILFFTTCLNRLNTDVIIDKTEGNDKYLNRTIYENNEYKVYLYNYELEALADSGVIV